MPVREVVSRTLAALFALGVALLCAAPARADDPVFDRAFGAGPADLCTTVCRAGSSGSAAAQLSFPASVAISAGEVYVADQANHRVSVYGTSGTFARAFGSGVNMGGSGNPDVCTTASTCRSGFVGAGAGQLNNPYAVAVSGGEVYVADASNNRVSVFTTGGAFMRAFGKDVNPTSGNPDICTSATTCRAGSQGSGDAQLSFPLGIAVAAGEVYVADASNNRISVYSTAGAFARAFGTAGNGAGQLSFPFDISVSGGEVYVADQNNNRITVFSTDGTFARAFGKSVNAGAGSPDVCTTASSCRAGSAATASGGSLKSPLGIGVSNGEVYVSDAYQRISVFLTDGTFARALGKNVNGGSGSPDVCTTACQASAPGGAAGQLNNPAGLTISGGEVYVADSSNYRIGVFSTAGVFSRAFGKSVWGASPFVCTTATGCGPGAAGGSAGQLNLPLGVAVAGGEAYVADQSNNRIGVYAASGAFSRAFGKAVNAGSGNPDVCTLATTCRTGTGGSAAGQLSQPAAVAVASGAVYVADQNNQRISVFATDGTFLRAFGKNVNPGPGNADLCTAATTCQSGTLGGAAGQLDNPVALAVSGSEVYVTDQGNRRVSVFGTDGTFLRAFGKDVNPGSGNPDICTAATACRFGSQGAADGQLSGPFGVTVSGGEVYVADHFNARVSVYSTAGVFARAFGKAVNAGTSGNPDICTTTTGCRAGSQGGAAGQISFPSGVAVGDGAVYVAERYNARVSVFGTDGVFVRAFGSGVNAGAGAPDACTAATTCRAAAQGYAAAQLTEPMGLAMVGTQIYAADRLNQRIAVFRVPRTEISPTPVSLAFGARDIDDGATAVKSSTIANTGTEPVTLTGLSLAGDAAQFQRLTGVGGDCAAGTPLAAGDSCVVRLQFDPSTVGGKGATLTITSNAPPVTVALSGTGIQTQLSTTPVALAFGARDIDDGPTTAQSATITNTGTQTVSLSALTLSGDAAHFARLTGAAGDCAATTTLVAGAACSVRVAFDPSSIGAKVATVSITSNAGPSTIDLSGSGIQTQVAATPGTLAFGARDIDDGPAAVATATVSNPGTEPVTLSGLTLTGDTTQFTRLTGAAGDCVAGGTLTAGATCALRVRFDPTTTGAKAGTLAVTSNAAPVSVALTGSGTQTQLAATPAALAFGNRSIGDGPTAAQTSIVANVGSQPVTLSALTLSGDTTEFARLTDSATDCAVSATLAAGATCTLRWRFDPGSSGAKAATLTIASNAPSLPVALSGTGVHTELSRSPAALTFGERDLDTGATPTQTATITNTGSDVVTLTGLTFAGDATQFARVGDAPGDCTTTTRLDPAQSCAVRLRFDPSTIGAKAATLTIASNAPALVVALSGSGVQTEISSDPPSLAFGSRDLEEGAAGQSATVANTGSEPVTLTSLALSGDVGQFARLSGAAGDCATGTALDAGDTCKVRMRFDPVGTGPKSATVTIASNAPTLTVVVTGTGTTRNLDTDGDGTPDNADTDDDNDGAPDDRDAFPLDPSRQSVAPDPLPAPAPPPAPTPAPVQPAAQRKLAPWRLKRTGRVKVRVRGQAVHVASGYVAVCPKDGPRCLGTVTLKLRRKSARTRKVVPIFLTPKARPMTIAPGTQRPLSFTLSERGAGLLRRLGAIAAVMRGAIRLDGQRSLARKARLRLVTPPR
ncbi:MAG TPA: choice-of-anchor D domain-containing protein [Solirubrobacteraceae bacterium]|jgi:DNA-binding beta-propeller fold protein YncE